MASVSNVFRGLNNGLQIGINNGIVNANLMPGMSLDKSGPTKWSLRLDRGSLPYHIKLLTKFDASE